jgi:surface antigen
MREQSLFAVSAATISAFVCAAAILLSSDFALAGESSAAPAQAERPSGTPKFAVQPQSASKVMLDETDQIAALESVQFALTEVGDGASYIWHRNNGRLSGLVQPTGSFKGMTGEVCRHVMVMLTSGTRSKKTEGVACRLPSGQWRLEG